MGFRDEFLQSGKSYLEAYRVHAVRAEGGALTDQTKLAAATFRKRLEAYEQALDESSGSALRAELAALRANSQEWQGQKPGSNRATGQADSIQQICGWHGSWEAHGLRSDGAWNA